MLNNVTLAGRLTKDPEIRYTQTQKPVASFSIACDRDFKDANGNKETDFFNCVAWNNTATFMEKYLHKGDMVALTGRLQRRTWKDRDGGNRETIEVNVQNVYGISGKRNDAPSGDAAPVFTEVNVDDGELPF